MAIQAQLAKSKERTQQETDGARLAIDIGKTREQHAHQKEVTRMQTDVQRELAAKQSEAQTKQPKKESK